MVIGIIDTFIWIFSSLKWLLKHCELFRVIFRYQGSSTNPTTSVKIQQSSQVSSHTFPSQPAILTDTVWSLVVWISWFFDLLFGYLILFIFNTINVSIPDPYAYYFISVFSSLSLYSISFSLYSGAKVDLGISQFHPCCS